MALAACAPRGLEAPAPPGPVVLHVAVDGDDRFSGALAKASSARTDGPVATLARARDLAREVRARRDAAAQRPVEIVVHAGTYRLAEPLVLGPEDSGTKAAPLVIRAAAGERAVISGGAPIEGLREATVHGRRAWIGEVPAVKEGAAGSASCP
jgi:hypothetical protein